MARECTLLQQRLLGQHALSISCVVASKAIGHLSTIVGRGTSAMVVG
jgi:hypothetical protein